MRGFLLPIYIFCNFFLYFSIDKIDINRYSIKNIDFSIDIINRIFYILPRRQQKTPPDVEIRAGF